MNQDRDSGKCQTSVRAIFEAALEIPPSDRPALLDRACAGDAATRARVVRLLSAHQHAGEFLALPALGPDGPATEELGAQIGPYTLLERIGEGGFGTVFLAEQEAPIRRSVALKIIKPGMDSRQVIVRFEAERQALALMDHPSIAKVLDAGATDTGRPYFVMELVRGDPLTSHCDAAGLGLRERLELFRQVCQGVQHAHQKGIIHRDLKPSNVLVVDVDGRAVPKIIDFGIAKATGDGPLPGSGPITEFRQLIGTPQYMSPEQIESSGDIDTRSDVYSLGVLLYELLTGTTPFEGERLRSAPLSEVQRIIRVEEPPRPSTRVLAQGEAGHATARRRRTDPARLAVTLRSDLDWIVMKCLEKERSRRYGTANALANDIGRYLAGEPVNAAPPSTVYLARKFLRRHRGRVAAAGLVAISLLAAVAGTTTFAVREARRADETNEVAALQARMLSAIDVSKMGSGLREDLLTQAVESWGREGAKQDEAEARRAGLAAQLESVNFTTASLRMLDREIFEQTRAAIEADFGHRPRLKARLLQDLASTMRTLGLLDKAVGIQTEVVTIRVRELGAGHLDTLESMHLLARLQFRHAPREAEPYARAAFDGRLKILGPEHPDTLASQNVLGMALLCDSRFSEAEPHLLAALDGRRRVLPGDHPDTFESIYRMAQLYLSASRPDEAEAYALESLSLARRSADRDPAAVPQALMRLANVRTQQARYIEAGELWREVIEHLRRLKGDDFRDLLFARHLYGWVLLQQGRLEEAEVQLIPVLRSRHRPVGESDVAPVGISWTMGELRLRQGRSADAESFYRQALDGYRAVRRGCPGGTELHVAGRLAEFLDSQERALEAAEIRSSYVREFVEAFSNSAQKPETEAGLSIRFLESSSTSSFPLSTTTDTPDISSRVYVLLRELRDDASPQQEFLDAVASHYGADDPRTFDVRTTLALHLSIAGRRDEAAQLARQAVTGLRHADPASDRLFRALDTLATILCESKNPQEALPLYEEALDALRARLAPADPRLLALRARAARCLMLLGRFAEAERLLIDGWEAIQTVPSKATGPLAESLALLHESWHKADPTADHDSKAAEWRSRAGGSP